MKRPKGSKGRPVIVTLMLTDLQRTRLAQLAESSWVRGGEQLASWRAARSTDLAEALRQDLAEVIADAFASLDGGRGFPATFDVQQAEEA